MMTTRATETGTGKTRARMTRAQRDRLERMYHRSELCWRAAWSAIRECRQAANDFVVAAMEAAGRDDMAFAPDPPSHYVTRVRVRRPGFPAARPEAYVTEDGEETWLMSPRTGHNKAQCLAAAVAAAIGLSPEDIIEDGFVDEDDDRPAEYTRLPVNFAGGHPEG